MNRLIRLLTLSLLVAAAPSVGRAAEHVQTRGRAAIRLEAPEGEAGNLVVPLSGKLLLTVTVEGPPLPSGLYLPVPAQSLDWEAKPQRPSTTPLEKGRSRWRQQFTIEPRGNTGSLTLQLGQLTLDNQQKVEWDPVPITVTTEVSNADVKEARDVRPPEPPPAPPPSSWPLWLGVGGGVLFLVLLGFAGWEVRRRLRPKTPPLAPHEWALLQLERIEAMNLPDRGEVNRHHTLLSEVLRRYLEMRFRLPASRQTTSEFLHSTQAAEVLQEDHRALLRDILERCDLAKFAGLAMPIAECHKTGQLCRHFVETTKPQAA